MLSADSCFGTALRARLSQPGMEKLPCLAVAVMCPACLMMRRAHLRLAWCRHWGHHHVGHHRRWHHHMWHPLGLVCLSGLLPVDRRLHPQNHKARRVGLRKTSFCFTGGKCMYDILERTRQKRIPHCLRLSCWNLRPRRTFQAVLILFEGHVCYLSISCSCWDPRL